MNTNKIATGSVNKKLLAALAVLAVAIVALAAIPAAVVDSDAAGTNPAVTYSSDVKEGIIAAGYVHDKNTGKALINSISGASLGDDDVCDDMMFVIYYVADGGISATYKHSIDSTEYVSPVKSTTAIATGSHAAIAYFHVASNANEQEQDAIVQNFSPTSTYTVDITLGSGSSARTLSVDIKGEGVTFYQDVTSTAGTAIALKAASSIKGVAKADGSYPTINGFRFTIAADTTGEVSFSNLTMKYSLDENHDGKNLIQSSATVDQSTKYDVVIDNVDIQYDNKSSSDSTDRVAVLLYAPGKVTITNSTIENLSDTIDTKHKEAVQVYYATDVVFTGNEISGFNRGLNLQQVSSVTITGNTFDLDAIAESASKAVNLQQLGVKSSGTTSVVITGNEVSFSGAAKANYEVTFNDADGETAAASKVQNFTTDADVVMLEGNQASTVEITGTMTLQNGGSLTVMDSNKVTVDAGATLAVESGATLLLEAASTANIEFKGADGSTVAAKLSVASGATVAVTEAASGATDNTTPALTARTLSGHLSEDDVKTAYVVSADSVTGVTIVLGSTLAYEKETVTFTAAVTEGYKISSIGYTEGTVTAVSGAASQNDDGTWSFTMPAAAAKLKAVLTGAYTASFEVYNEAKELVRTYTTGPYDPTQNTISKPDVSISGYVFEGTWYTDRACLNAAGDDAFSTALKASVTYYGKLFTQYAVTYDVDADEATVTGAAVSLSEAPVSFSFAAKDGYVIDESTLKAVYTDASGAQQTLTVKNKGITSSTENNVTTYKFSMPAYPVTVSVDFDKLYKITSTKVIGADGKEVSGASVTYSPEATQSGTVTGYKAATKITLTAPDRTSSNSEALSTVAITAADGSSVTYSSGKFTMPASDVSIVLTYEKAYKVNFTSPSNGEVKVSYNGIDVTFTNNVGYIPASKTVVVSTTGSSTTSGSTTTSYGVATGYPTVTKNGDTVKETVTTVEADKSYTFTMPAYDVDLAVSFSQLYAFGGVQIIGAGNISYDKTITAMVQGATISFTDLSEEGITLQKITVNETEVTSFNGTNDAWKHVEGSTVYTYTMGTTAVTSVLFTFDETYYYNVTLSYDSSAGNVKLYQKYENGTLSGEVTELDKVVAGKYYIKLTPSNDNGVPAVSATYGIQTISAAGVVTKTETTDLPLSVIDPDEYIYQMTVGYENTTTKAVKDYTVTVVFQKTSAQIELEDAQAKARDYLGKVQEESALKQTIPGGTIDWNAEIAADTTVYYDAYSAVANARDAAAVQAAVDAFDAALLKHLQDEITYYLGVVYNNGEAYYGYTMTKDAYDKAVADVAAVSEDSDDSIINEVAEVIGIYTAALDARTAAEPTPGEGAATKVTVSITSGNQVFIYGNDGYVPAGTVTVLAFYQTTTGGVLPTPILLTVTNVDQERGVFVDITAPTTSGVALSLYIAGTASYASTAGSVTAVSGLTALQFASSTATENVAATTEE